MKDFLLGIDLGTGGCKLSVINVTGCLVASSFCEYQTANPHPGWSEQDPDDWYFSFRKAFATLLKTGKVQPQDIRSIGLDASTHNAVLLDSEMKVIRPCIMWTDQRSVKEVEWLKENYGEEIFQIAFQKPSPTWTLPQLLWIRNNESEAFARIKYLMFTKDYLRYKLTDTWETDYVDAQGSMCLDLNNRTWSETICAMISLPLSVLPPLVAPTYVVGNVTEKAAQETGLTAGIPVIAGASDTAIEDYGAGAISPGQCIVKMATAGNVNIMTSKPIPTVYSLTYGHVIPGLWYTAMGTNSAAASLRWFRDVFCYEEKEVAVKENISEYEVIDKKAAQINPGADGLFFHPYLMGERSPYWDANLRASFVGASSYHGKGHFIRSVLEGVAYSLRDCFTVVERLGLPAHEIRAIGGGAKSNLWRNILADVLARPILKVAHDDASFGSALAAGVGVGIFADLGDAVKKCVKVTSQVEPHPDRVVMYQKLFETYKEIHDNLTGTYQKLQIKLENFPKN
jgi:xylulokinase